MRVLPFGAHAAFAGGAKGVEVATHKTIAYLQDRGFSGRTSSKSHRVLSARGIQGFISVPLHHRSVSIEVLQDIKNFLKKYQTVLLGRNPTAREQQINSSFQVKDLANAIANSMDLSAFGLVRKPAFVMFA